jgi:hypothetical protein
MSTLRELDAEILRLLDECRQLSQALSERMRVVAELRRERDRLLKHYVEEPTCD